MLQHSNKYYKCRLANAAHSQRFAAFFCNLLRLDVLRFADVYVLFCDFGDSTRSEFLVGQNAATTGDAQDGVRLLLRAQEHLFTVEKPSRRMFDVARNHEVWTVDEVVATEVKQNTKISSFESKLIFCYRTLHKSRLKII